MQDLWLWPAAPRLSCSSASGILAPQPDSKPMTPALAGRFLTTGPPGKSPQTYFNIWGFLGGSVVKKKSSCQSRRHKFNPWVRKILWRKKWQPILVLFLPGNPMDRGAWWATFHGVVKSRTWLSDWAQSLNKTPLITQNKTHTSTLI